MDKNFSRGRLLVSMTLGETNVENTKTSPVAFEKVTDVQYGSTSTPKRPNETQEVNRDLDESDLIQISDIAELDLTSELRNRSFASIYREVQELLLEPDVDLFGDDDFNINNNQHFSPNIIISTSQEPISECNSNISLIENSGNNTFTVLQSAIKPIKILANSSDTTQNNSSIKKPSVTIPETPNISDSSLEISNDPNSSHLITDHTPAAAASNELDPPQRKNSSKVSKQNKLDSNKSKHPMLNETCSHTTCKRKCTEKLSFEQRQHIWQGFWSQFHSDQMKWLARYIHFKSVSIRTTATASATRVTDSVKHKRNETREYFLPDNKGKLIQVCKKFLLNTLGYKNDSILTTISKKLKDNPIICVTDKRGSNEKPQIDRAKIEEHINSYKPCTAHYRRHNAPNVRYMPVDITLEKLYNDFIQLNPDFKCCKEIYRSTLKAMNVSLRRPQSDKCSDCVSFETEIKETLKSMNVPSLKLICKKTVHKFKANNATQAYKCDAEREFLATTKVYSMDLQKTVLLPMIPDVKDCFFTNRLVALNLTFCGLKKGGLEGSKCIVWHEATGGRDGKDIVNAIYKLIKDDRDTTDFIFWADNCTAQNKNWILYTALINIVHIHDNIESITLKYLTKGHTHMSADGVHGNIEKNFKKIKNLYDFTDYKNCVQTSRKNNIVLEVDKTDKFNWEKKKRVATKSRGDEMLKKVHIKDFVEVKFVKNSRVMLFKNSFDHQYQELDFLQKRFQLGSLPQKDNAGRGVKSSKKKEIIEKLVPLMPASRANFWTCLLEDVNAADLITDEVMAEER